MHATPPTNPSIPTGPGDEFVLGVNYWPRSTAMGWWRDFDDATVDEDFGRIAGLGLSIVRIFLLWEHFQPEPERVDADALAHLERVVDLAERHGLGLDVTFFTGHMSGPNWAPPWMLLDGPKPSRVRQVVSGGRVVDRAIRDPYENPMVIDAERRLLHAVVTRFAARPGVAMWNLGNEPDLFAWPRHHLTGRTWVRDHTRLIHELDPGTPVTCGLHVESLQDDVGLRVPDIFAETDVAVMHGYPMYQSWSTGPLDPWFVPFMCALTAALCGRPTLAEEFGGCTAGPGEPSRTWSWRAYGAPREQFMASEHEFAEYLDQVLDHLVVTGATGAMLWCWADYAPELWTRPPCDEARHERHFGIIRPDGSEKPHAEVLRRHARRRPTVQTPSRPVELDVDVEAYYADPLRHAARRYRAWRPVE